MSDCQISDVLIIEPFYGGSHKQLIDVLQKFIPNHSLVTLPAKKWHWRARCGALVLADRVPPLTDNFGSLFCSSVLSLSELLGLRPELNRLRKIVYFHENEVAYPKQKIKERDVQFAYNQITTCLVADTIVFNSEFNKHSFLAGLNTVVGLLPDKRPKNLLERIVPKTRVVYFPVEFPVDVHIQRSFDNAVLHVVWPHRWEFDKDPDTFLAVMMELDKCGCDFRISLLGETFTDVPAVFQKAQAALKDKLLHFGHIENKTDYFKVLSKAHVAVSTANHEFFGVSMMEATHCGCMPLVPNRLAYPEFYPQKCWYKNDQELLSRLKKYCENPNLAVLDRQSFSFDSTKYSSESLKDEYLNLFKQ